MRNRSLWLIVPVLFAAVLVLAQAGPRVTSVAPESAKVEADVTITGENLAKDSVSAIYLSDESIDHKATVVSQEAGKAVIKVPQVKPGRYNVAVQVGNNIFIQPVLLTVQE